MFLSKYPVGNEKSKNEKLYLFCLFFYKQIILNDLYAVMFIFFNSITSS